ncbi:hypothetical protein CFP56_005249 [Quercus suber]|uniref:Uncharacterized protein n=1 Tax=Quercus suber TaxID=58331 RepID=A0AAW0IFT3_QUESU
METGRHGKANAATRMAVPDESKLKFLELKEKKLFCSSAEQKSWQILLPQFNTERCSSLLACEYIEGQNNKQFSMQWCLRRFTSLVFQVTWYIKGEKYNGLCLASRIDARGRWMAFKSSCKQQTP